MKKKKGLLNNLEVRLFISRMLFGLLAIFGIVFIIIGTVAIVNEMDIKNRYVKMVGTAISNMETNEGLYVTTYAYIYNDQTYTVQADYAILNATEIGKEETVYVNPENPKLAVVETFNENVFMLVIGAMMLVIPLALYMIDPDSQKDDKNAILKAGLVIVCGLLFYIVSGTLIHSYLPNIIWKYSPLLVIMPIIFIAMGIYAVVKILIFKKEAEAKKHRLRNFFKIRKKK